MNCESAYEGASLFDDALAALADDPAKPEEVLL